MRPKEIVHRFLASMGRPEATEQYLRLFRAEQRERFALVVITASAVIDSSNAVVDDLILLSELELSPVLCLEDEALAMRLQDKLPDDFPLKATRYQDAARVANSGKMPLIIACNEAERTAAFAHLKARKAVYLISQSGLQPKGQGVRSLINMRTDYSALVAETGLRPEQAALLTEVRSLFANCSHTFTVSLTSAQDLLRELFTVKGAGTLVRRGTQVKRVESLADLEHERFAALLASAFGRPPADAFFARPPLVIYLADHYQGAAVLEDAPLAPYLSKFAVDIRAQGEGIGGDLWRALTRDHKRFFWRSRPHNAIAAWYASTCDGLVRGAEWTVYWRGLETSEIGQAVDYAQAAPIDFGATT